MNNKICLKCLESKDTSQFSKDKNKSDGLQKYCKNCSLIFKKEHKEQNLRLVNADGTRICKKCTNLLMVSEFANLTDNWCRNCLKEGRKNRRLKNLDKENSKNRKRNRRVVEEFQKLKTNIPCVDCNKIYEPFCMDFDHVRGEKIDNVSRMVLEHRPQHLILEEIEKCDLVCCLCHNKRTFERQQAKQLTKQYNIYQNRNIKIIEIARQQPCNICKIQYETYNMQFDHIDPSTKFLNISQLKNYKLKTLLEELKKVQILCALCHRRKSIIEQQNIEYKVERLNKHIPHQRPEVPERYSFCTICEQIKLINYFGYKKDTTNHCQSWCKECHNAKKRKKRDYNLLPGFLRCSKCTEIKEKEKFIDATHTKSGKGSWCKDCYNEYRRNKRKTKINEQFDTSN